MHRSFIRLRPESISLRYAVALLCTLAALLTLRLFSVPYPDIFLLFIANVLVSAWFGGFGPGALTTLLSAVAIITLSWRDWPISPPNIIELGTFVLVSLLISWLMEGFYRGVAAARERETWFHEIFEGSRDAVFLVNESAGFIEFNRAACDLTGYSREELRSMSIPDLHDEADLRAFRNFFGSIMGGEDLVFEAIMRRKDGTKVPVEFSNRRMMFRGEPAMHTTARDITERKRIEERLRKSEDRYRDLVDHGQELICTHDLTGRILSVNPWASKVLGCDGNGLPRQNIRDILAPETRGEFDDYLDAIKRDGVAVGLMTVETASGERRIWEYNNSLRTEGVDVPIVRGIAHDVTERKRAEQALRESEERYKGLADSAFHGVVIHQNGVIKDINRTCAEMFGYEVEELVGENILSLTAPEQRELVSSKIANDAESPYETIGLRKDGSYINIEVLGKTCLYDGKPARLGAVRDFTDRKRAEESLRRAEEKYRGIFEKAVEGIFQSTPEGQFISINPAMARMYGYQSPEEMIAERTDIERQHYVEPQTRARFKRLLETSDTIEGLEAQVYRKDGSKIWTSESVRAVRETDGHVLYYEGFVEDITERKDAEKAREQLLKDRKQLLSRLVKAQEEERRRIARELHDQLGQQITALMLGLKWLEDSGHCQPPATKHLDRLREYADQLGREIHNIAWELRPTALDDLGLHTALSNYLEKWSEASGKTAELHSNGFNGHRLSAQIETTLYRVIQEALTNVLKHSQAKFVSLILERRNNHVLAIIEDDGCGFNVEAVMSAPDAEQKLGLFGMRERLALVFGTLDIESTPGAGTSLFVRIPTPPLESESAIQ